jgi:hypothetical protein
MKTWLTMLFSAFYLFTYGQSQSEGASAMRDSMIFQVSAISDETADIVKDSFSQKELLIYPTKTTSIVNIIITSESRKVYQGIFLDSNGKLIKSVVLDALHNEVNLKDLAHGAYSLRIMSGEVKVLETKITKDASIEN